MSTNVKSVKMSVPNLFVVLGLILLSSLSVFGIGFLVTQGQFLYAGTGIILLYLMFMGSDLFCRKCFRSKQ